MKKMKMTAAAGRDRAMYRAAPDPRHGGRGAAIPARRAVAAVAAVAVAAVAAGCHSLKVENYGSDVVRDADGKPVMLANGEAQTVSKGWRASEWTHWTDKDVKDFSALVERGRLNVKVGSYSEKVSQELVPFVKAMFDGAATLAAKVGAAIATAGGSAGADTIAGWVSKFVGAGGDAAKAKVTSENGVVTITDGVVTCVDGNCSYAGE